jgi:hypothetical protein
MHQAGKYWCLYNIKNRCYQRFSYFVFFIFCSITEAFSHVKSGFEGHSMGILNALSISNRPRSYFAYAYIKQIDVTLNIQPFLYLQEGYYVCWLVHGSVLHSDQCTAGCEAHMNFANGSIHLLADNIQNVVVTIHRPQVLKMLFLSTADQPHFQRWTVETNCKNEPC